MGNNTSVAETADDLLRIFVTKGVTAEKVKQRQVTLEESIKENEITGSGDLQTRLLNEVSGCHYVQFSAPRDLPVYATSKGLVDVATIAYNQHHDLVWRPDDVWQAILTQFSLYVMKNAESLRDKFVDFKGKKQLTIVALGTLYTTDFGDLAKRMVDEQIVENIKDPTIAEWILPNFTSTTENDRIVASVTMMATLKAYFQYSVELCCGLPSVTLLGSVADWKLLRQKVDRLLEFDNQSGDMKKWHKLLTGVLDEFVKTKSGAGNFKFWKRICDFSSGSGTPSISGWISVFAVFNKDGEWQGDSRTIVRGLHGMKTNWPVIEIGKVPSGAISVPVHINDNGTDYDGYMMAGQFAFDGEGTSVQPRSDWCIAINGPPARKA